MKTVVALLVVACTVVHAVPSPDDASQMRGQSTTTPTPSSAPSASSMSPESTNSMSTPNIADQGKQPPQLMPSPSSQTPSMPQEPMTNAEGGPSMMGQGGTMMGQGGTMMGQEGSMMGHGGSMMGQGSTDAGSQTGQSPQPQNMYQMGMSKSK